ncbi:MAG: superoxide dismutase [Desulfococcaceae bacterium]
MKRREFLKLSANLGALALFHAAGIGCSKKAKDVTGIELPGLPYAENALEPHISGKMISLHYGKHHRGYADKLGKLIAGTSFQGMGLEEIILKTYGKADQADIFNNAAQVFNHNFYWNSMKPGGGGKPGGKIAEKINASFGSYEKFAEEFANTAASRFGSGWAWLVTDGDKLKIMDTANADTPIARGIKPLLTIDVWEHAYYPDYQNRRGDYIKVFTENLINWDYAEKNLG